MMISNWLGCLARMMIRSQKMTRLQVVAGVVAGDGAVAGDLQAGEEDERAQIQS